MMMCLKEEANVLGRTPLFAGMDCAKLRKLAFVSDRVVFSQGDVVIREGDDSDVGYVILRGTGEVTVAGQDGPRHVGTACAGVLVGEGALLAGTPHRITVTASSELETLRIRRECLMRMLQDCPVSAGKALSSLSRRVEGSELRLVDVG